MSKGKKVLTEDKRPKKFGIEKDVRSIIEGTSEYPWMYHALGTEPKTSHPFNLYSDIKNQIQFLENTISNIQPEVNRLADEFIKRDITKIIGIGMGTSQFVALSSAPAFWDYAGIEAIDEDSAEFIVNERVIDAKTALIAYSGSGSTTDTINATKKAKKMGAFCIAVVSVAGSPLTKITDTTLVVSADVYDTGGSDTFHYTTRLAAAIYLAIEIGKRRNPNRHDFKALEAELHQLSQKMGQMFEPVSARCWNIAKNYKDIRSIIIVGSGPNFGTAEEMGLKFEEMAHVPTRAMVPTRHIHGALGLTNEKILTILFVPLKDPAMKWLKQISEVTTTLKAPSIGIVSESETEISDQMDYVVRIPTDDPILFTLLAILPGQLIPYFFAVEQGNINPDCQKSNIPKHAKIWNKLFPPGTH